MDGVFLLAFCTIYRQSPSVIGRIMYERAGISKASGRKSVLLMYSLALRTKKKQDLDQECDGDNVKKWTKFFFFFCSSDNSAPIIRQI